MDIYYVTYRVSNMTGSYLVEAEGWMQAADIVAEGNDDYYGIVAHQEPVDVDGLDDECQQVINGCIATDLFDSDDVNNLLDSNKPYLYLECGT